jgi:hypothetical protein
LLYFYFHKPALENYLEKTAAKRSGVSVEIDGLHYRLFPLRLRADAIRIVVRDEFGELRAAAPRVEAEGSLRRILRKEKPYLETLNVSELKIEYSQSPEAPPSEELSLRDLARLASDVLAYCRELDVTNSGFRLGLTSMESEISGEGFSIRSSMNSESVYRLRIDRLSIARHKSKEAFAGAIESEGVWEPEDLAWYRGSLRIGEPSLALREKDWEWKEPGLLLEADVALAGNAAEFSSVSASAPGLIEMTGTGRIVKGESPSSVFSAEVDIKSLQRAREILNPFLPGVLPRLIMDGELSWNGDFHSSSSPDGRRNDLTGALRLSQIRAEYRTDDLVLAGTVQGEIRLWGPLSKLSASGHLEGKNGRALTQTVEAEGVSLNVPVEFSNGRLNMPSIRAAIDEARFPAGPETIRLENVSLKGESAVDTKADTIQAKILEVEIPSLGSFEFEGLSRITGSPDFAVNAKTSNMEIGNILETVPGILPEALSAWQPAGKTEISLDLQSRSRSPRRYDLRGHVRFQGLSFQNPEGSVIAEGIGSGLKFETSFNPSESETPVSFEFDLERGESLWNAAYFNWGTQPFRMRGRGEYERELSQIRSLDAVLNLASLGEFRVGGNLNLGQRRSAVISLSAPSLDLESLYAFWAGLNPSHLSPWSFTGSAAVDVHLSVGRSLTIRGRLRIPDATGERMGGATQIAGLKIDMPFCISNRTHPAERSEDLVVAPGRIRIEGFKTPAMSLDTLDVSFLSARNLFLLYPFETTLWGSRLGIGKTVVSVSPVTLNPRTVATLSLEKLDLSRLPASGENFSLTGTVSIPNNALLIEPGELTIRGRILAEIYGGEVTIENLRTRDALSTTRTVSFNARIKELDLEKLTDSVPFGRITGIIDVTVDDFALSYGQPESFDLTILSVKREGVPRKFSLKAVDDLSVISSGGSSSMPSSSFLTRFVSSFNYDRIGISCSLKNDIFVLQSTIVEGGVHYLVRRSPLFGIDVVNKKPVNRIGFKDMLGRLKRIGQSQEKK